MWIEIPVSPAAIIKGRCLILIERLLRTIGNKMIEAAVKRINARTNTGI